MPIQTKCEHCGHPYIARDDLAGRRVRCRQCGLVFVLSASASDEISLIDQTTNQPATESLSNTDLSGDTTPAMEVDQGLPFPHEGLAETRRMPAVTTSQSNMTGGVGSAKSMMERPDYDPGEFAVADDRSPGTGFRPALPFDFPFAGELDRWLPWGTIALMLFWVGMVSWNWRPYSALSDVINTPKLPDWSGAFPLGLLLLIYVVVWLPLMSQANRSAAKANKFILPEHGIRRAAAIASIPFALGSVFWLGAESIAAGITGMVLGLGLALLAAWFLLRLRQKEIPFVGIAYAIGGIIATLLSALLIYGADFALSQTILAMHMHQQFPTSPLGPDLPWDMTRPRPTPDTTAIAQVKPPTSKPAPALVATPDAAGGAPISPPQSTALPNPQPPVVANPGPDRMNQPIVQQPAPPAPVPPLPWTAYAAPQPPANQVTLATLQNLQSASPMVVDAQMLPMLEAQRIVYPQMSAKFAVAISPLPDSNDDLVEWYRLDGKFPRLAKARVSRNANPSYALSPDGDLLAWVSNAMLYEVQVRSLSQEKVIQKIQIPDRSVQTRILGFTNNTTMLVEYRGMRGCEFDLVDLSGTGKSYPAPVWTTMSQTVAVFVADEKRPETTRVAAIVPPAMDDPFPALEIFPVGLALGKAKPIILPLPRALDQMVAMNPTGIAFSPDGKQVAVSYEAAGQLGVVLANLERKTVNTRTFALPSDMGRGAAPSNANSRLTWLSPGDRWLYAGRLILDGETEKILASFDALCPVLQQKLIETAPDPDNSKLTRNTLQLLAGSPQTGARLVQITVQLPESRVGK